MQKKLFISAEQNNYSEYCPKILRNQVVTIFFAVLESFKKFLRKNILFVQQNTGRKHC